MKFFAYFLGYVAITLAYLFWRLATGRGMTED